MSSEAYIASAIRDQQSKSIVKGSTLSMYPIEKRSKIYLEMRRRAIRTPQHLKMQVLVACQREQAPKLQTSITGSLSSKKMLTTTKAPRNQPIMCTFYSFKNIDIRRPSSSAFLIIFQLSADQLPRPNDKRSGRLCRKLYGRSEIL